MRTRGSAPLGSPCPSTNPGSAPDERRTWDARSTDAWIDPRVWAAHPDYVALLVVADGLVGRPVRCPWWATPLARRGEGCDTSCWAGSGAGATCPRWRSGGSAFAAFGVKPRVARSSVEALVRRCADGLPRIWTLTDLYNAVSVRNLVPIGGEDLDGYEGPPRLVLAEGSEAFDTVADGQPVNGASPRPGESGLARRHRGDLAGRGTGGSAPVPASPSQTTRALFIIDGMGEGQLTEWQGLPRRWRATLANGVAVRRPRPATARPRADGRRRGRRSQVSAAWAGLLTGLSLIVAIGAQNAYVLRQGLAEPRSVVVAICAIADAVLIVPASPGSARRPPRARGPPEVVRWVGVAYLTATARLPAASPAAAGAPPLRAAVAPVRRGVAATTLAFTFLNPHVYIDTVLLLGSIGNQYGPRALAFVAWVPASAPFDWFSALGFGARHRGALDGAPSPGGSWTQESDSSCSSSPGASCTPTSPREAAGCCPRRGHERPDGGLALQDRRVGQKRLDGFHAWATNGAGVAP